MDKNQSIQPTVANPQTITSPISPEKKQKTRLVTVLLILTVISLGATGYFGWQNYQLKKQVSQPQLTPSPTASIPTPTTTNSTIQPKARPTSENKNSLHLYPSPGLDTSISINNIHIISLLFVPNDITTVAKQEWFSNMNLINSKIEQLFKREFQNNLLITHQVVKSPVKGMIDTATYTPTSLVAEAKEKTKQYEKSDSYNVWMVYLVRDEAYKKNIIGGSLGGLAEMQAATQYEFWLDNEAVNSSNPYGIKGSAHEFGHALGIPHPWELPANINNDPNYGNISGDLMGYSNNSVSFDDLYIRDDVKKAMGL